MGSFVLLHFDQSDADAHEMGNFTALIACEKQLQ
jgi:hypothetical protein